MTFQSSWQSYCLIRPFNRMRGTHLHPPFTIFLKVTFPPINNDSAYNQIVENPLLRWVRGVERSCNKHLQSRCCVEHPVDCQWVHLSQFWWSGKGNKNVYNSYEISGEHSLYSFIYFYFLTCLKFTPSILIIMLDKITGCNCYALDVFCLHVMP